MNRLSTEKRIAVIAALVEGNSVRSTSRLTGVSKPTILKLLVDIGDVCSAYQDRVVRNVACKRVQCDEIWAFLYAKRTNVTEKITEKNPDAGDTWTWTAIDSDSKLILSWRVGGRTTTDAHEFMADVASRINGRVQLSTDGLSTYPPAVANAFGEDVDYGTVTKMFKADGSGRYSPPVCTGCELKAVVGEPDYDDISTSHVERNNLTLRMSMRRFTRLTNGFSRKLVNHAAAVALHFMHYNFCRVHGTLRVTPAMEAGLCGHAWSITEIVSLLDDEEAKCAA